MSKVALITGITGQDGSYLAEFLLDKGYEVHGITRRASISNTARIDHLMGKIRLHDGDLTDSSSLIRIIGETQPDEIYNLAAQSHVQVSFDVPEYSGDVDALGVLRVLEAVRILGSTKKTKVYQASTSELYGKVEEVPQRDTTPFHPYSPYAVAKQYGFWMVKEYREAYGMFAVNGILFNHESERRGENFVTRKITRAAGRIACHAHADESSHGAHTAFICGCGLHSRCGRACQMRRCHLRIPKRCVALQLLNHALVFFACLDAGNTDGDDFNAAQVFPLIRKLLVQDRCQIVRMSRHLRITDALCRNFRESRLQCCQKLAFEL